MWLQSVTRKWLGRHAGHHCLQHCSHVDLGRAVQLWGRSFITLRLDGLRIPEHVWTPGLECVQDVWAVRGSDRASRCLVGSLPPASALYPHHTSMAAGDCGKKRLFPFIFFC